MFLEPRNGRALFEAKMKLDWYLTASPVAFTASLPKQKHSRAKSRQLCRLLDWMLPIISEFTRSSRLCDVLASKLAQRKSPLQASRNKTAYWEFKMATAKLNRVYKSIYPNFSTWAFVESTSIRIFVASGGHIRERGNLWWTLQQLDLSLRTIST